MLLIMMEWNGCFRARAGPATESTQLEINRVIVITNN